MLTPCSRVDLPTGCIPLKGKAHVQSEAIITTKIIIIQSNQNGIYLSQRSILFSNWLHLSAFLEQEF